MLNAQIEKLRFSGVFTEHCEAVILLKSHPAGRRSEEDGGTKPFLSWSSYFSCDY